MALGSTALMALAMATVLIGQTIPDVPVVGSPGVQWTATGAIIAALAWILGKHIPKMQDDHKAALANQEARHAEVVKSIVEGHTKAVNIAHDDHLALQTTLHNIANVSNDATRAMITHCSETIGKLKRESV